MTNQLLPIDDTRDRILKAASEIMAEKGYTRTTTRAIAKAADVNEVTIFRHFGSKRNLLSEMIHQHSALPELTAVLENQLTGEYRLDLVKLGTIFYKAITARKEALRLMLCEAKELPEIREVIVQIPDQLRQTLKRYFQNKIEAGYLRKMNPDVMAQCFLGMFFSYGIAREILESSIAPEILHETLVAQFVDVFIAGTLEK